jgi:hypothetical protein
MLDSSLTTRGPIVFAFFRRQSRREPLGIFPELLRGRGHHVVELLVRKDSSDGASPCWVQIGLGSRSRWTVANLLVKFCILALDVALVKI